MLVIYILGRYVQLKISLHKYPPNTHPLFCTLKILEEHIPSTLGVSSFTNNYFVAHLMTTGGRNILYMKLSIGGGGIWSVVYDCYTFRLSFKDKLKHFLDFELVSLFVSTLED